MHFKNLYKHIMHHTLMATAYTTMQNVLSPPYCAVCSILLAERAVLCTQCSANIKPVVSTTIEITPARSMRVFAVSDYQEPLKRLIISKAWSDYVAGSQLGALVWEHTYIRAVPFDVVVPIPLHWTRYAWRGYNQAEEMARAIAKLSARPTQSLLRRNRSTPFQSSLLPGKRSENVRNVFCAKSKQSALYEDKHILLVDDLMTTGSTLKEAAKALLPLKPATITAVVACRVV